MIGWERPLGSGHLRGSLSQDMPSVQCLSLQKGSERYIPIDLPLRGDASNSGRSGETFLFCVLKVPAAWGAGAEIDRRSALHE